MGHVYAEITLKNATDVVNVQRGIMKEQEIRQITVESMVDTGAGTIIISEALQKALGLELHGKRAVYLANDTTEMCNFTEPVAIHWKDRHTFTAALVLPGADEVLLGAIPLEDMDLIVDPARQALIGAHGDKVVCKVK